MLLGITTTGKVVLLLVAGTFIAFSLVVSMLVPRRSPTFPGTRLRLFVGVCVLLFAAQIGAVLWVTGTQEVEENAGAETTPTQPTTTGTAPTTPAAEPGNAAAGKLIFKSQPCGGCHTLKDAGTNGNVGPNLDQKKPPYSLVIDRVTHGKGVMPSFGGTLSVTQIQDVAKYVSTVAGT